MEVSLRWVTPNGDQMISDMARISAPENVGADPVKLIGYLIRNEHWSPFEMVNLCLNITTTRDIGRQILRHSTLRPQEFSQRYADVRKLGGEPVFRPARMQDPNNRQASLPCEDETLAEMWLLHQQLCWDYAIQSYKWALDNGIAKEVARVVLPEGMTPTAMAFNGPLRSWLHFCRLRMGTGTQTECTAIATACYEIVAEHFPAACAAWDEVWAT